MIFRIEDSQNIFIFISKLADFNSFYLPKAIPSFYFMLIVAFFFSFFTYSNLGKKAELYIFHKESYTVTTNLLFLSISLLLFIISLSSITSQGFNPFIYFRF